MDDNSFIAFITGFLLSLLAAAIVLTGLELRDPDNIAEAKCFDNEGIRYNVTIDTAKTDSLFGKTWRK